MFFQRVSKYQAIRHGGKEIPGTNQPKWFRLIFNTDVRTTLTLIDSLSWCTEETCTVRMQSKQFDNKKNSTLAEVRGTYYQLWNLDYVHNAPSTPFIYSIKLSGIVLCNVNDMIISLLSELSQHIHIQNAETVFFFAITRVQRR